MKKTEFYTIKYKLFGHPYFEIVNGTFREEANAMNRAKEMIQDQSVSDVVVHKRKGYKSAKIYSFSNGFECVYMNRQLA